jgi:glutamyl-tRNA reductase
MEDGSINGLALEGVAELLTNADVLFISIDSATVTIQRDMVRSYMGYDH